MTETNVIIKNANLNLLRGTTYVVPSVEVSYKGFQAPCVVFEDEGVLAGVAYTVAEYGSMTGKASVELLQDAKSGKLKQLVSNYSEGHLEALNSYSLNEQATFASQELEYLKWSEDNTALTPTVDQIATARNVGRLILLPKIGLNLEARNIATGQQQALEDAIKACTTLEELESIEV